MSEIFKTIHLLFKTQQYYTEHILCNSSRMATVCRSGRWSMGTVRANGLGQYNHTHILPQMSIL